MCFHYKKILNTAAKRFKTSLNCKNFFLIRLPVYLHFGVAPSSENSAKLDGNARVKNEDEKKSLSRMKEKRPKSMEVWRGKQGTRVNG